MEQEINCSHEFRTDLEIVNRTKNKPKQKQKQKQTKKQKTKTKNNLKGLFRNGD